MENSIKEVKALYNSLSELEQIELIEKIMPHAGVFRVREQNAFTDAQYLEMRDIFLKKAKAWWRKVDNKLEIETKYRGVKWESISVWEGVLMHIYLSETKNNSPIHKGTENNSWIKIESEADLPETDEPQLYVSGKLSADGFKFRNVPRDYWDLRQMYKSNEITHYRKIHIYEPPIF